MILLHTNNQAGASFRSVFAGITFSTVLLMVTFVAGCGSGIGSMIPDVNTGDGTQSMSVTNPPGSADVEPNDDFSRANLAGLDSAGVVRLDGSISQMGDLDVFLLGAVSPGDKIIVDADTTGSELDVSVALFDDLHRLVYANDDRGGSTARFLDSYIEWIVRHAGESYYLVVTNSGLAEFGHETGRYQVDVQIIGGAEVPAPAGQILLLDFGGAVVDSPVLGSFTLSPFDAVHIDPSYRGETDTIKEAIRAVMEQDYERFNVTIMTSDDLPPLDESIVSTMYFGGAAAGIFGIAEGVDLYNADFCDDALIYTESFSLDLFTSFPTAAEIAIAIGNVASHEAGHLLGLNHVSDDRALMDDQSPVHALLQDQRFMEAPLSSDIMPIGTQDAVLLLDETVGPSID